jgi:uncharacterized protein YecT (DUF1311 family)
MTNFILSMIALTLICLPWSEAGAQTQRAMNEDAAASFKAADKKLNVLYQKILKDYADDPVFIESFKKAQRCWIAFRDAQLKMKYPDREPGYYGSAQPMFEIMYLTELTKDRIKGLQAWIEGAQEGDLSAGTVRVKQ